MAFSPPALDTEEKSGFSPPPLDSEETPEHRARQDELKSRLETERNRWRAGNITDAVYNAVEGLTPHGLLSWPTRMWNAVSGSNYADPDTTPDTDKFKGAIEGPFRFIEQGFHLPPGAIVGSGSPISGIAQGLEETAGGIASFEGGMVLPAAANPIGRIVMGSDMLRHAPEQVEELKRITDNPNSTVSEIAKGVTMPLISLSGAAALAGHGRASPEVRAEPGKFKVNVNEAELARIDQQARDATALREGSPFVRATAPAETIPFQLGEGVPQFVEPSGMSVLGEPAVARMARADIAASPEMIALTPERVALRELQQELLNRQNDQRAIEAGSPFLRERPVNENAPIPFQLGAGVPQNVRPSGLREALTIQPDQATGTVQPPAPTIAPPYQSGLAAQTLRERAGVESRAQDFPAAVAERVSQEQTPAAHPEKALTDNQLKIIQDSLKKAVSENQFPEAKTGGYGEGVLEALRKASDEASSRLEANRGQINFNLGPLGELPNIRDFGIVLANKIARGGYDLATWTADAVKQWGEGIKPHIQAIWDYASNHTNELKGIKNELQQAATEKTKTQDVLTKPDLSADELINMRPDEMVSWKKNVSLSPKVTESIASKLTDADVPKLELERDNLRAKAAALNDQMDKRGKADDTTMRLAGEDSVKAQTINEVLQDYSTLKKKRAESLPEGKPTEASGTTETPPVSNQLEIPPVESGKTRLYQGSGGAGGAGTGGSFFTSDPQRASSYGPNVKYVDVPSDVFKAGKVEARKAGMPTSTDALIPDEWVRQSKPHPTIEQMVHDAELDVTDKRANGNTLIKPAVSREYFDSIGASKEKSKTWVDTAKRVARGDLALTESAEFAGLSLKSVKELDALVEANKKLGEELNAAKSTAKSKNDYKPWGEIGLAKQFIRETIEVATNAGSNKETARNKIGERPLDFQKNPEVAKWLQDKFAHHGIKEDIAPTVESVKALDPASGSPLTATDSIINRLETPGLISGSKLEKWADKFIADKTARQAAGKELGAGLDPDLMAAYIVKGAAMIERGITDGAKWTAEMIKQHGKEIRPFLADIRKQSEQLRSEHFKSAPPVAPPKPPASAQAAPAEGGNIKMRSLSERGTQAESIPEPVREKIAQSPESFYEQQRMSRVEEQTKAMTDEQLADIGKDSDIYTASKLEQVNRLFDSGKNEHGERVFQDLAKELTRAGQIVNQAKLLNALRPENVVRLVNEGLRNAKRDPLTAEQAGRLQGLASKRIEGQRAMDRAAAEWMENPTDANAAKAEKALIDANRASLGEQRMVHNFQNRSIASLTKAILQGNLLTPISQVANVVGNVNFAPFRSATRSIASVIDMVDATIRNRPREVSVGPVSGTGQTVAGLIRGIKQIPDILMHGQGDVIKGEARAGLHPLRAWVNQFAKNPDVPTIDGKIPLSDRVKMAIEGTFGAPAEVMLRGLAAGDIAFREAGRARLIAEQSRLKNVPESQRGMAQKFPEIFFDKKTLERIESETRGAIFQRHSKTLDHVMSWLKGKGDFFDLLAATIAPYKLTPWNIVGEILSYNPLVAMGKTALESKRGNIREAEMNAAKVIVGSTLAAAGAWLYNKGLLAPSMDSPDERNKARVLAGEVLPPNHINVSGLKRALSGGDPEFKPGDETRDIFRAGGLAGSMFYMAANVGRDMETKPESDAAVLSILKNSTIEQARFGMNQSFLKGVVGLLDSVREGETDNFIQSYASTVLSAPLPNTLSALSRARREYKVDTKGDGFIKQIENPLRARLGFSGLDETLPLKRGLWGEPLTETPKDRNALLYHFFDITKGRQVTDDPVPLELYRLWRKTGDTSIIPTPPGKTLTFGGTTYLLKPEQQSRLAELIGTTRKSIVDRLFINPAWHAMPEEAKIKILNTVYDKGSQYGKGKFWLESDGDLVAKPEKAGFNK